MIALPSQLPLLRIGEHDLTTYEVSWITRCIRNAAEQAGHADWWIAEDIAKGVIAYLRTRFKSSAITLEELEKKIRQTLVVVGFGDVAAAISVVPPPMRLNLKELARQSDGIELMFFKLLDQRVSRLTEVGARILSLCGTKEAVKHLRSVKSWNQHCRVLEEQIVSLVQRRLSGNHSIDCELKLEAA
jgi:hypothetical protein